MEGEVLFFFFNKKKGGYGWLFLVGRKALEMEVEFTR